MPAVVVAFKLTTQPNSHLIAIDMSETTNERPRVVENDGRLTVDRKSPVFAKNQEQRVCQQNKYTVDMIDQAKLVASLSLNEAREVREAPQEARFSLGQGGLISKNLERLSPTNAPESVVKRRYARRNSKTASMLGASVASLRNECQRCPRRNAVVASTLYPLTKAETSQLMLNSLPSQKKASIGRRTSQASSKEPPTSPMKKRRCTSVEECGFHESLASSNDEPALKRMKRRNNIQSTSPIAKDAIKRSRDL